MLAIYLQINPHLTQNVHLFRKCNLYDILYLKRLNREFLATDGGYAQNSNYAQALSAPIDFIGSSHIWQRRFSPKLLFRGCAIIRKYRDAHK